MWCGCVFLLHKEFTGSVAAIFQWPTETVKHINPMVHKLGAMVHWYADRWSNVFHGKVYAKPVQKR